MAIKRYQTPDEIIKGIVATDFDLSQFEQIDDSEFPSPPNFYENITGRDFANATLLQWQIEAGMNLFSDYCPQCTNPEYLTPDHYIKELFDEPIPNILDNIEMLQHGVCPKCKKNRLELFSVGEFTNSKPSLKSEFVGNCGQRSGKSKFVVSACYHQLKRWLKLPDPLGYYGLPRMEAVLGTFSAMSAEQAEENLWLPFKGLFDNSPWFAKYNKFLKEKEKTLSTRLCDVKDTFIYYHHKRILCSFTGSEARKKRGRTRLWGVMDEIAHMNSDAVTSGAKKKIMDADGNYTALSNSLETIKNKAIKKFEHNSYDTPLSIMYNASSPFHVQDKIMRLTKTGPDNPWFVVIHRATWELNPDYTEKALRSSKGGVSEVEFMRDWGAIPPYSDSPFIGEPRTMERLCATYPPVMEAAKELYKDPLGDTFFYLKGKPLRTDKITPRLLALDNGHSQNAFAAVLFRYDSAGKKPIVDFAVSVAPDPVSKTNIHFPAMFENFILPILKSFRIMHVFYDRWQSLEQIQKLRDLKINAQAHQMSFDKDLLPFRQQLLSGNCVLPACEIPVEKIKESNNPLVDLQDKPISTLIWQTLTVRQVGKKLLKPLEGDDDLFRAFALGCSRFLVEEVQKSYFTLGGVRHAMNRGPVGTYISNRSRSGNANSSGTLPTNVGMFKSVKPRR
jgi:hypothetical protein